MAIDLTKENKLSLTTQQMYDIISFSIEAADDNGFMNSFIFNRAIYLFAAIVLFPDHKEEFADIISANINDAWDQMKKEGIIDQMIENYPEDLEALAENGEIWFNEYTTYAHSARGLLDTIQMFTGDIVKAAAEQLQSATVQSGIQEVQEIADKWGMNNEIAKEPIETKVIDANTDSVFE